MLKLIVVGAVGVGLYLAAGYAFDSFEQSAYQAKAVQCAMQPERLGCDQFQTASGFNEEVQP